jgi:hypothetical protein
MKEHSDSPLSLMAEGVKEGEFKFTFELDGFTGVRKLFDGPKNVMAAQMNSRSLSNDHRRERSRVYLCGSDILRSLERFYNTSEAIKLKGESECSFIHFILTIKQEAWSGTNKVTWKATVISPFKLTVISL